MTNPNNFEKPKLGYWFYPAEDANAPGGNRLEIVISETPSLAHFDPERVELDVKIKGVFKEHLKIVHPWDFDQSYQVLKGIIEIVDRKGKKEEAFSFGGSLTIDSGESATICTHTSPAPILEMSKVGSLIMLFIEEIEILFAERSASLLAEPHLYEQHLANADPYQLYLACLQTLIEKYDSLKTVEKARGHEFRDFLHRERRRLREAGLLPREIPPLSQVL